MPILTNKPKKMGRPQVEIDLKKVEQLSALFCTDEEIAAILEVSRNSIKRVKKSNDYQAAVLRGKSIAKSSLRRMQWESAKGGNITMQIYLGKVVLRQEESGKNNEEPIGEIKLTVSRAKSKP